MTCNSKLHLKRVLFFSVQQISLLIRSHHTAQ